MPRDSCTMTGSRGVRSGLRVDGCHGHDARDEDLRVVVLAEVPGPAEFDDRVNDHRLCRRGELGYPVGRVRNEDERLARCGLLTHLDRRADHLDAAFAAVAGGDQVGAGKALQVEPWDRLAVGADGVLRDVCHCFLSSCSTVLQINIIPLIVKKVNNLPEVARCKTAAQWYNNAYERPVV